jgi:tetratricopeptide (TPR) repeat protein
MGTPDYMSPEQVRCEDIDARSDVFTMGVILYELLTGKLPFDAPTPLAAMLKRVQGPARPPIEADPAIPKALSEIVAKCMAMDPAARYRSSGELLHALQVWRGVVPKGGLTRTWKWITASLAALLVVAGGIATREILNKPPPKQKTVTLLVADFQNTTGDPLFDGTLEPMFSIAMEGASFINAYNRVQARQLAGQVRTGATRLDEDVARLVAVREGLSVVVAGAIALDGKTYRCSVRALDAVTGKVIASQETKAAEKNKVLAAMPKLAAPIRKALGDSTPASAQLGASETFTAGSLEAAHSYFAGQEFQLLVKYDDAIRSYRRTIELDQNFGRAYSGLGVIYRNLGQREEAEKYLKLALAHIGQMSERERFRTRGAYYVTIGSFEKAVEEYSSLVKQFPADNAGHANLGICYLFLRNIPRAIEEGRKAVEIYPKNVGQRNNVAQYLLYNGNFDEAEREANEVLKLNPSFERAYLVKALSNLARGRIGEAAAAYDQLGKVGARGASSRVMGLGDIALYEGRAEDAAALLEKGAAEDLAGGRKEAAAAKRVAQAQARLLQGKTPAAIAAVDRAVAGIKDEAILFRAAQVYVEASQDAKARAIAADLGKRLEPESQAYAKLIEGELILRKGDARGALRPFGEARKLSDTWIGRLDLGRAYLQAEAYTEADSEFDACLKRRGEATSLSLDALPTYAYFAPVHYFLGRAREGLGSPSAAESYRSFLKIKEKANRTPLVTDARKRLGAR